MTSHLPKIIPIGGLAGLIFALTAATGPAQQQLPPLLPPPGQPAPVAQPAQANGDEPEVLARGPVHEAYAATAEAPAATPVVPKQPPEPIEELPPDEKPEGENVQWIPGYWHWDDDADRYIWISGFWRVPPPGRLWVPGSWREVRGGWQWVPGFWQEPAPEQPQQPEIQYLPQPPDTIEVGPSVPAPTVTHVYSPGCWVWRGRYVWRPGFWIEHRPGWVWVPPHFRWTPVGHVFVEGYWDYPLVDRGVLYAPVYFAPAVVVQPAFVYTPRYVISEPAMVGALFVRRGWGNYYFGDYFAPRHATVGFTAWCGVVGPRGGFTVGFGVGRTWGYDPLWSYYSVARRRDADWFVGVGNLYGGRYRGDIARPPVNLVQQNTVINNITNVNVTNVTNNVTVVNKNVTVNNKNVTDVAMLAPARVARDLQPEAKIRPISAEVRKQDGQAAKEMKQVGAQRARLETAAVAKGGPVVKSTDAPQTLKLDVSKTVAAKAVAPAKDEKKAPPPNPIRDVKTGPKVDAKVEPKFTPKVDPKTDPNPKADPKTDPKVNPKVDPKIDPMPNPKVDPKNPKVDPKDPLPNPKGEPKTPKIDPKNPKVDQNPKVDPKADPKVPVNPKVDPKTPKVDPKDLKVDPKTPVPLPPKVDPKDPLERPRGEPKNPKVDPKAPVPQPKVDPKTPKVDPNDPFERPRGEPKKNPNPPPPVAQPKQPVNPPVVLPKAEPKQPVVPNPVPPPKVEPKQPPKAPVNPVPPPKVEPKNMPPVPPKVEPKQPPKAEPKKEEPKKKDAPPPPPVAARARPAVPTPQPARLSAAPAQPAPRPMAQPRPVAPQQAFSAPPQQKPAARVQANPPRPNPQPKVQAQPAKPNPQPKAPAQPAKGQGKERRGKG